MQYEFEWDPRKAKRNRTKHDGVAFEEAKTVFDDDLALVKDDPDHSDEEMREILIGRSSLGRLLTAHFTERSVRRIRIFSARLATPAEVNEYYIQNQLRQL